MTWWDDDKQANLWCLHTRHMQACCWETCRLGDEFWPTDSCLLNAAALTSVKMASDKWLGHHWEICCCWESHFNPSKVVHLTGAARSHTSTHWKIEHSKLLYLTWMEMFMEKCLELLIIRSLAAAWCHKWTCQRLHTGCWWLQHWWRFWRHCCCWQGDGVRSVAAGGHTLMTSCE